MASVVLLSGGIAVFAPNEFRDQIFVGLSIAAAASLLVYFRFGCVYAAMASIACAAFIPLTFDRRYEVERIAGYLKTAVFKCDSTDPANPPPQSCEQPAQPMASRTKSR